MAAQVHSGDLAQQAKFVFQGTVRKLKAATMKEVPVSDDTVVVRIDRVIHAPEALHNFAGQEITVRLKAGEKVKAGRTLSTRMAAIFGTSLAVQSAGHDEATPGTVAALASHPEDARARLHGKPWPRTAAPT